MNAGAIASTAVAWVDAYDSVANVAPRLLRDRCVGVKRDGQYIGVLDIADVAASSHTLVIDSLREKPPVQFDANVDAMLHLLTAGPFLTLPVMREGIFYGVIGYAEVLAWLKTLVHGASPSAEPPGREPTGYSTADSLIKAERFELLSLFATGVAHDVKNMMVILGSAYETLLLSPALTAQNIALIESAMAALKRSCDLLDELQRYANAEKDLGSTVDAGALIERHTTSVVKACRSSTSVHFSIDPHLRSVTMPPEQLGQVIGNLVLNAVQAMDTGGILSVGAKNISVAESIVGPIGARTTDEPFVQIEISDNGSGICEEALQHIFTPHYTTKAKGTGLGLTVVKGLVDGVGGAIRVESTEGKGTTVIVSLPAVFRYVSTRL